MATWYSTGSVTVSGTIASGSGTFWLNTTPTAAVVTGSIAGSNITATLSPVAQATMTGSISGQTLTISGVTSGAISIGQTISGGTVLAGTIVTGHRTGAGGVGTYTVNQSQTVNPGTTLTFTGSLLSVTAASPSTIAVGQPVTGPGVAPGTMIVSIPSGGGTGGMGAYWLNISQTIPSSTALTTFPAVAIGTGSITVSGTQGLLTVPSIEFGAFAVGQEIIGPGVASGTMIVALGTGVGAEGTYYVTPSQVVASTTMTGLGATLKVSMVSSGVLAVGQSVAGVAAGTLITGYGPPLTGLGTSTGGTGNYIVNISQNASGSLDTYTAAVVTGTIASTVLTVTAVTSGSLEVGQRLIGSGVTAGTTITAFRGTSSGGVGSYTLSTSSTVSIPTVLMASALLIQPGSLFVAEGQAYEITQVSSVSGVEQLTLATAWAGGATPTPYGILIAPTSSVEDMATVATIAPPQSDQILVKGYSEPADGGGGVLVYSPSSTAAPDGGITFPAVTGRYIRPVDGILHTKWFGINHNGVSGQTAALQSFFNAVVNDDYMGFIDPGVIECDGATVYINSTGTRAGGAVSSALIRGAGKLDSQLSDVVLSVGDVANSIIGASPAGSCVMLSSFEIQGYLDLWSPQTAAIIDRLQIRNPPLSMARAYSDVAPSLNGYLCNIYDSLQLILYGVYFQGSANGASASTNIVRASGFTNLTWLGGGVTGIGSGSADSGQIGFMVGSLGLGDSGYGVRLNLSNIHFEGLALEAVYLNKVNNADISCDFRTWPSHNSSHSTIQLGNPADSSTTCSSIVVEGSYGVSMSSADTFLTSSYTNGMRLVANSLTTFATGFNITSGTSNYTLDPSNFFTGMSGGNTFIIDPAASRSFVDPTADAPLDLGTGSTIAPPMGARRDYTITLTSTGQTIQNPASGFEVPQEYTLVISKTHATDSLTSPWGSQYLWVGGASAAPTFASMSTTQHAKVSMKAVKFGTSSYLLCDYAIYN